MQVARRSIIRTIVLQLQCKRQRRKTLRDKVHKPRHKVKSTCTFGNDFHNNAKMISQPLRIVIELNWFSYPVALAGFYYFLGEGGRSWRSRLLAGLHEVTVCVATPIVSFSNHRRCLQRFLSLIPFVLTANETLFSITWDIESEASCKKRCPVVEQLVSQSENVLRNKISIDLCYNNCEKINALLLKVHMTPKVFIFHFLLVTHV